MNPVSFFSDIVRDIRFAVRMLYKNRSFALSALVTLGLGSSVGIVIYTVIYGFAFRPLPVKDPNNVKKIYETVKGVGREWEGSPFMFSHPEYLYYRDHNSSFSDLIAYAETNFRISGTEELNVPGELVSGNYFPALGLSTTLGRTFTPEEDQTPVANPVAIISTRLWRQRFSSSLNVIGRSVPMNGVLLNIIGVAAPNVVGAEITAPDVWVPIMMEPLVGSSGVQVEGSNLSKSNCSWLTLLGRLRPGTTTSQAQAEMALLASQYDSNIPDRRTTITVTHAAYLTGLPTAAEMRQLAAIVSVVALAVVLILLIVCTNVSNLFLARAMVRRKEFAIKVSQGATRGRLIQELLTESVVIGLIGGGVALGVAWWMMKLLSASIPDFPAHLIAAPDLNILLVTLLVAVVTGLSSGLPPALSATRLNINSILKEEGFGIGRRKRSSVLGSLLLVAQLAGCLVLLISTALLARGLQNTKSIDLGFEPKNVYLVSVDFQQQKYDDARASVFYRRLLEQLEAIPDVKSVSLASTAPLLGVNQTAIVLETDQDDTDARPINFNMVTPEYFKTMGVQLLSGPGFSEQDARSNLPLAIVSQAMAERYWRGQDPVGKHFKAPEEPFEIRGVARNVHNVDLADEDKPFFYSLARTKDMREMKALVRTNPDSPNLLRTVRSTVATIDPGIGVSSVRSVEEGLSRHLEPSKISVLFSTTLMLLALVVATVGVYGVTAYATSQRTREIGIRMALGAQRSNIVSLFIKQGVWPIAAGVLVGVGLAAVVSRLLVDLLFNIDPMDPVSFIGAAALLSLVALVAMYVPAARATKVSPTTLM